MAFRPYLLFKDNCRQAFSRYHEIFGGELSLMAMKDVPGETPDPELAELIIHAAITIGDGLLMASDDPMKEQAGPVNGMMVAYEAKDDEDARRVFDALAAGGTVTQDLIPTFFSTAFGMCTDRFGVPWILTAPEPSSTPTSTS